MKKFTAHLIAMLKKKYFLLFIYVSPVYLSAVSGKNYCSIPVITTAAEIQALFPNSITAIKKLEKETTMHAKACIEILSQTDQKPEQVIRDINTIAAYLNTRLMILRTVTLTNPGIKIQNAARHAQLITQELLSNALWANKKIYALFNQAQEKMGRPYPA